jgi:outer membrane biosynthesis protein TonB
METEGRRHRRKRRREKSKRASTPSQKIVVEDFSESEHDFFQGGDSPATPLDDGFDLAADPPPERDHRKVRVRRGVAAAVLGAGLCVAVIAWVTTGSNEPPKVEASMIQAPAVAEAPKPVEAAQPVETPKPVEIAKPVETPKPAEIAKPAEMAKPVEIAKPIETAKPVEAAKPVETPKPIEPPKPAAKPALAVKPIAAQAEIPRPADAARTAKKEALRAFERGDLGKALIAGQDAIALDPTDAEAWLVVGAVHQQRGNDAAARKIYRSCASQARRGPRDECVALSGASR